MNGTILNSIDTFLSGTYVGEWRDLNYLKEIEITFKLLNFQLIKLP